jgi:hypothetical protein
MNAHRPGAFLFLEPGESSSLIAAESAKGVTIMKTHNRIIYHCLTCGNVVHAAGDARRPQCCGSEMVKAAAETIRDADDETETNQFETPLPAPQVCAKPR